MVYLALLLPACLGGRRSRPLLATIAAALILIAAGWSGHTGSLVYLIPAFAVMFLLSYSLGGAGFWPATVAGPALLAATAEVLNRGFNPFFLMVTFGPWAAGAFVGSRQRLAAQLAETGQRLQAERSRYAAQAVQYERAHLARELHDTVAHWLTAVVIQARAGQVLSGADRQPVADIFGHIAAAAHRATAELAVAAALGSGDEPSQAPALDMAARLIDAVRAAGTDVTFHQSGHHVPPPAVAAAAVRVIQEGLTNAIKHSPGAPISVTLRTEATGLDVEIVNGPAVHEPLTLDSHEGGTGLAGLGQRVQDHGGHVVAGPAPAGGWCLAATFPAGAPPDSRAPARKQRSTGRLAAGMLGR